MAEIEHFVNPNNKKHPKFKSICDLTVPLFSRKLQTDEAAPVLMKLGDAVNAVCDGDE